MSEALKGFISREPGGAARGFLITGAVWLVIGVIFGLVGAIQLVAPDLLSEPLGPYPWLSFGRVRAVHTNIVIFGFFVSIAFGGALYLVPRLCRTHLASEPVGRMSVFIWNAILVAAVITLLSGDTQGREYAELNWPLDLLVLAVFVLMGINVFATIARRKEPILYVSLWYICGAILWTAVVYSIGNVIWYPSTGSMTGITDAVYLWFYGHNVVGLLITPFAIAMAYYIIPKTTNAPLYSHTLSLAGFWLLLIMYTHTGTHHLLQAPVPPWLKVISVVDSIGLLIPVFTALTNMWYPLKDRWGSLHASIAGRFVFAGTVWYALTCIQGPIHSLPAVQKITHFNNWVVAHAHIAVLGFGGMIAMGAIYHILPQLARREIYSQRLADLQYWLVLVGLVGMFLVLSAAGLIQGNGWRNGEATYRLLPQLNVYFVLRLAMGGLIVTAAVIQVYNVVMTLRRGKEAA